MHNPPLLLLVEDESIIRSALAGALEDCGYALIEAEDGEGALQALANNKGLAGLITDIRLGIGENGWEVARQFRHHFPRAAVVYMTGDSAAEWTADGVPNSILLQKPFATAQVITAVSTLLNLADTSSTGGGSAS